MTPVQVIAVASIALWFAVQALVRHRTKAPVVSAASADPGNDTPVTANMAVNNWEATQDAIPATVLDLVHRGVLKLDGDTIHVPEVVPDGLRTYEDTLVRHLRLIATDRVVAIDEVDPADKDFQTFFAEFARQAGAEADFRGWAERRLTGRQKALLFFASVTPAVLAVFAIPWPTTEDVYILGTIVFIAGSYWLGKYAFRGPSMRPTAAGAEITARWQGYRVEDAITTATLTDIAVLGRKLAYATALGKAEVALWLLSWGVDHPEAAWSRHSGTWRRLRIWYPWMLGWGYSPRRRVGHAVWKAGFASVVLFGDGLTTFADMPLSDSLVWVTGVPVTVVIVLYALAALDLVLAVTELLTRRIHVGWVLRWRPAGEENIYVALEENDSTRIKAYKMPASTAGIEWDARIQFTAGIALGRVTHLEVLDRP
ncbi:hypothetical protein [Actinocrispum sp. NPDC049592]|uniref:DUF2207 family protein n=1 Tax=Actinocrispum sp. NPDC049592 TaxID=3154835 RepID=UPI003427D552